ncbi:MAG: HAD-IB family phosphatase [Spirochaetes bacterium]|nr:HAD-IB family phosphatase [Spirochaetota bacterium]
MKYAYSSGKISSSELLKGVLIGILHRVGIVNTGVIIRKWADKYSGVSEQETIDISNKWFNEIVVHHFRESILSEIKFHKENNGRLVILSASTPYICRPVKEYLGLDDIICTELEVREGLFTGRLKGKYCHGKIKLERALEYCTKNALDIESAYYYGDSIADRFVLEKAGSPVCISPDWKLKRLAERSGWRIIAE